MVSYDQREHELRRMIWFHYHMRVSEICKVP